MALDEKDLKPFIDVLEEYKKEFETLYKSKLEERRATGRLIKSVKTKYEVNGSVYEVSVDLENWWYWAEHGRKPTSKGKHCPIEPIITWIRAKGIVPRESNSKLPMETQLKQFAYAIRAKMDTAVKKDGQVVEKVFEGGQYMQKTLDEINGKYTKLLQEALNKCVGSYIINKFNILPTN